MRNPIASWAQLKYKVNISGFPPDYTRYKSCQDETVTSHLTSPDESLAFHTLRFAVEASLVTAAAIILRFLGRQSNSLPNMSIFVSPETMNTFPYMATEKEGFQFHKD